MQQPLASHGRSARQRRAGLLLHPTSLPGGHGVGDLGAEAYSLLQWLSSAGLSVWQVLPVGPVDAGGSPYTSRSALAGNLALVDLRQLVVAGLLDAAAVQGSPSNGRRVDWPQVLAFKVPCVLRAAAALVADSHHPFQDELLEFERGESAWLDDFALYETLRAANGDEPWWRWPAVARDRDPEALQTARVSEGYRIQVAAQYLFQRQWMALRAAAESLEIALAGDAPIYVAHDSADVWAQRHLFQLDADGHCTAIAGVPPDAFSEVGQLWGNPLYDWPQHEAEGFAWWQMRMRRLATLVHAVRIDHFRGLAAYWKVPADAEDARLGRWDAGPGAPLLRALAAVGIELWAEDLGVIDDGVIALRDGADLPGMAILQFAWDGDPDNPYLPYHHVRHQVAYTGTHDNDTVLGWWATCSELERHRARVYFGIDGHDLAWDLIRACLQSVADCAMVPVQDVLALGSEARMNAPGKTNGNWAFRLLPAELGRHHAERLRGLCATFGRLRRRTPTPGAIADDATSG